MCSSPSTSLETASQTSLENIDLPLESQVPFLARTLAFDPVISHATNKLPLIKP